MGPGPGSEKDCRNIFRIRRPKIIDSREECRNRGPILSTGAAVEISNAAPAVEIRLQFRQASRESTIFGHRMQEIAK